MLCLNKIALSQYFLHVSLSRGLPSCCLAATYIMVLPWYSTKSAKHAETFSAVLNPWESILTPDCISCQNTLVIDTPRVRKQTRHYSSMKEDELMEYSELESDSEDKPIQKPRRPQDRTQGYPRSECFRVEKNLLVYGWVQSGNGHIKVLLVLTALYSFLVGCSSLKILLRLC